MTTIFIILLIALVSIIPGFGIIYYILRGNEKFNSFDSIILSLIISPVIVVTLSFLEVSTGLSLSTPLLLLNIFMINSASLYLVTRLKPNINLNNLVKRLSLLQIFVYLGMFVIFVARIWSVIRLQTPLLHDPISHSEWLKLLTDTGRTTNLSWYPQGLEYYLQYFTRLGGVEPAKAILLGTNVFLCLIPISLYYFARLINKGENGLFAVSALVISSVLAMPNYLFFTAGKNSMIMAFALVPLALYYVYKTNNNQYENVFLALVLFCIFTVHYPTGVFVYLLWGVNYALCTLINIRKLKKTIAGSLGFIIPTFGLLLLSLIKIYPVYKAFPASDDKSVSSIIGYLQTVGIKQFITTDSLTYHIATFGFLLTILVIGSVFLYLFTGRKAKGDTLTHFLMGFGFLYVGLSILLKLPQKVLGIFFNLETKFFSFFVLILFVSWFVQYFVEFVEENYQFGLASYIYIILGVTLLIGNVALYNEYRDAGAKLSTVAAPDIRAFDYIKENISSQDKILVQMARGNGVVMPTDAGAWISTYTNSPIEVDFSNFSKPVSEKIFKQYQVIGTDKKALNNLYCSYGIRYIYFGSRPVFAPGMDKVVLESTKEVTIVYNNAAVLYKVVPQTCPSKN